MKIIFKTIKYILIAAIVIMLGALAVLLWTERDPAQVRELAWTREAVDAYKSSEDGFRVMSITGFDGRTYSQGGEIGVSRVAHVVDLDEWQALIRYNNSTVQQIMERRGSVPYSASERFVYTLSDDLGHVYTDYHYVTASAPRHEFVRLIFDGVPLSFETGGGEDGAASGVERVSQMQINVYCREDVKDGVYPEAPMYRVYIYAGNAAQYDYKNLKNELPGDAPTEGIRSSDELF